MRSILCALFLVANQQLASAQQGASGVISGSESGPVAISNTLQFDMRSKHGLVYRIFVAPPTGKQPANGWPVVYHTDGNNSFGVLIAAVEGQSPSDRPALVVGIGYPEEDGKIRHRRRAFDLTSPADQDWLNTKAGPFSDLETGGCDQFLTFLVEELKPEIERRFTIDPSRQTLFGHSFGGLFTLHSLLTRPESFQTYVASSPSLWWNAGSLIEQEREFCSRFTGQELGVRLLVTLGAEEMSSPGQSPRDKPPAFRAATQIGDPEQLADRLRAASIRGMQVEYRELPEVHHGSAELVAAGCGVRFALQSSSTE